MSVILFAAAFAAALGGMIVIVDSAVRVRNAFRTLRARPADTAVQVAVSISFEEFGARPALPALRQRIAATARPARRPARSPLPSLHAAA